MFEGPFYPDDDRRSFLLNLQADFLVMPFNRIKWNTQNVNKSLFTDAEKLLSDAKFETFLHLFRLSPSVMQSLLIGALISLLDKKCLAKSSCQLPNS